MQKRWNNSFYSSVKSCLILPLTCHNQCFVWKDERGICIGTTFNIWNKKIPPEDEADKLKPQLFPPTPYPTPQFPRRTQHLHCWDEMQYKVFSSQTISQERVCEESKQLCSDWRQLRHETGHNCRRKEGRQWECTHQLCTSTSVQEQEATLQFWRQWAWTYSNGQQMMPMPEWARCLTE